VRANSRSLKLMLLGIGVLLFTPPFLTIVNPIEMLVVPQNLTRVEQSLLLLIIPLIGLALVLIGFFVDEATK
jgi:hypothetical protein